jgi:hypothetical protein
VLEPRRWAGSTHSLQRAGFANVWVGGHRPFGIEDAALMPLFTHEVIEVMRRTISVDRQDRVATAVIVKATKPRRGSDLS